MKKHLQEFTVHAYKGIHNLTLESLNAINILTGDNNSGKTSVLELLSTIGNPQDTDAWIRCARIDGLRIRDRLYFNGFYNMFPIDDGRKEIAYSLVDGDGKSDEVMLVAELEETQVSEKEMYRLNGLSRMRSVKQEDEVVDTVCMHLYTYLNQNKAHEDVIYDFQNILPRNLNKRKPYVKTVYVSPVDHAKSSLNLNGILSDPELYGEMLSILQTFDENIISINALKNENNPFQTEYMILTRNHAKALPLTAYD